MGRLCETEGLTDVQTEILKTVRDFVDKEILPVATELEHADEYPTEDRRGHEGARAVRADHPRGVRRPRRVPADLRPRRRGDRPRLDERVRHHQHPLHRGLHADAARHRGAEAEVPAADGDRRGARRVLDDRARLRVRRRGDPHQGRRATATTTSSPARRCGSPTAARPTWSPCWSRPTGAGARGQAAPQHDDVPDREGTRFRRAGRRQLTIPGKIEKMGYKGVDSTELRSSRDTGSAPTGSSAARPARASTR